MAELFDLLSALSGLKDILSSSSGVRAKQRQAAVIKWIKNLDNDVRNDVQRISGSSTMVSDFVGLLQFILVMSSRSVHTIILTWDPQSRPMLPKTSAPLIEPDVIALKQASMQLLSHIHIIWNGASPAELIVCPLIDVIPLLMTLSNGCCFTCMPKSFERVVEITWLRCSRRFTLAQYVAGIIELAIWRSWHNPRAKPVPSSQVQQMRQVMTSVLKTERGSNRNNSINICDGINSGLHWSKSLVAKEVKGSVRDIFDANDGKVPALVSVMKQRLKREQTYSAGIGREPLQNLWMLEFIVNHNPSPRHATSQVPVSSGIVSNPPCIVSDMVDELLGVRVLDSYSPIHEFRTRLRDRLLAIGADIAESELLRMMELSNDTNTRKNDKKSSQILGNNTPATDRTRTQKKKKDRIKQKKKVLLMPSFEGADPRDALEQQSCHGHDDAAAVISTCAHGHGQVLSKEALGSDVLSVPPSEITSAMRTVTQTRVIVSKIINDIVDEVFEAVEKRKVSTNNNKRPPYTVYLTKDEEVSKESRSASQMTTVTSVLKNVKNASVSTSDRLTPSRHQPHAHAPAHSHTSMDNCSEIEKSKTLSPSSKGKVLQAYEDNFPPLPLILDETSSQSKSVQIREQTSRLSNDNSKVPSTITVDEINAQEIFSSLSADHEESELGIDFALNTDDDSEFLITPRDSTTAAVTSSGIQTSKSPQASTSPSQWAQFDGLTRTTMNEPDWGFDPFYTEPRYHIPQISQGHNLSSGSPHVTADRSPSGGGNGWPLYASVNGNWYYYDYPLRNPQIWDDTRWTTSGQSANNVLAGYTYSSAILDQEYPPPANIYECSIEGFDEHDHEHEMMYSDSGLPFLDLNDVSQFHSRSNCNNSLQTNSMDGMETIMHFKSSAIASEELKDVDRLPIHHQSRDVINSSIGDTASYSNQDTPDITGPARDAILPEHVRSSRSVSSMGPFDSLQSADSKSVSLGGGGGGGNRSESDSSPLRSPSLGLREPLAVVLSCACLRSQCESAVLLNQLAVQRSLIGSLESSISGQLQPFFVGHEVRSQQSGNPALEVMSDEGDSQPFVRRIVRQGHVPMHGGVSSTTVTSVDPTVAVGLPPLPGKPMVMETSDSNESLHVSRRLSFTSQLVPTSTPETKRSNQRKWELSALELLPGDRSQFAMRVLKSSSVSQSSDAERASTPRRIPRMPQMLSRGLSFGMSSRVSVTPATTTSPGPRDEVPNTPAIIPAVQDVQGVRDVTGFTAMSSPESSAAARSAKDIVGCVKAQEVGESLPLSVSDRLISGGISSNVLSSCEVSNDSSLSKGEDPSSIHDSESESDKVSRSMSPTSYTFTKSYSTTATDPQTPTLSIRATSNPSTDPSHNTIKDFSKVLSPPALYRDLRAQGTGARPGSAMSQDRRTQRSTLASKVINEDTTKTKSTRSKSARDQSHYPTPDTSFTSTTYPSAVPTYYQSWPGLTTFGKLGMGSSKSRSGSPTHWIPNGQIHSILTREIVQFVALIDHASVARHRDKVEAVSRIRTAVQSLWPRAQVKPFGSFVTGLSLPNSDLDLVICLPKVHKEAGPEAPGALEGRNAIKESWQQNLARCLRREEWVHTNSITVVVNAPVPVIKLMTKSNVSLDVSFEALDHRGLQARKYHSMLLRQYPALRPLVLVLKMFLTRRGLCEAYTGGLSSYALLLIATRFLQELHTSLDVGAILLALLNFFGDHLDPRVTGMSVVRRCYFSRIGVTGMSIPRTLPSDRRGAFPGSVSYIPFKFDPLFVEDPLAPGNNVGRNCFRIYQVQRLWSEMHSQLMNEIRRMEEEGVVCPLLEILVGKMEDIL